MCLAVPMEVLEVRAAKALVSSRGIEREVSLDIVDRPPSIGDYVIVHAGFAIHTMERKEAEERLTLFEEMAQAIGEVSVDGNERV